MRGLSLLQTHLMSGPGTPRACVWLRGGAQPQTWLDGQDPGYPCVQFALTAPQEADKRRLCVPQEVSTIAGASQRLSSSLPSPALCLSTQLTVGPGARSTHTATASPCPSLPRHASLAAL